MLLVESLPTFRRNISRSSSRPKNKTSKKQAWNKSSVFHLISRWFIALLIYRHWRRRWHSLPKRRLTLDGLHEVIFQKTKIFRWQLHFYMRNNIHRFQENMCSVAECYVLKGAHPISKLRRIYVNRSRKDSALIGNRLQAGQPRNRLSITIREKGFLFSPESRPAV
jgi:hypothetical protein